MQSKHVLSAILAAGLLASAQSVPVLAENFPAKPIEIVVPYPAGGGTDLLARMVAEKLHGSMGQPVVVINKPGAGGQIGFEYVASAKPDGYTLVVATNGLTAGKFTQKDFKLDAIKDFTHVAGLAEAPSLLTVNASLPFKSVKEFVDYAKANPGKLNVGTWTSSVDLDIGMLEKKAGISVTKVRYKGSAPATAALLSNETQAVIVTYRAVKEFAATGKLRILGVSTLKPYSVLPEVKTIADSGVPGYRASVVWFGISGPAGMPEPIVDKLNKEINAALGAANIKDRLMNGLNFNILSGSAKDYADYVKEDYAWFKTASELTGFKPR